MVIDFSYTEIRCSILGCLEVKLCTKDVIIGDKAPECVDVYKANHVREGGQFRASKIIKFISTDLKSTEEVCNVDDLSISLISEL